MSSTRAWSRACPVAVAVIRAEKCIDVSVHHTSHRRLWRGAGREPESEPDVLPGGSGLDLGHERGEYALQVATRDPCSRAAWCPARKSTSEGIMATSSGSADPGVGGPPRQPAATRRSGRSRARAPPNAGRFAQARSHDGGTRREPERNASHFAGSTPPPESTRELGELDESQHVTVPTRRLADPHRRPERRQPRDRRHERPPSARWSSALVILERPRIFRSLLPRRAGRACGLADPCGGSGSRRAGRTRCPPSTAREDSRASPLRARSLFTVRAAISSAVSSDDPRLASDSLMCSYCLARFDPFFDSTRRHARPP